MSQSSPTFHSKILLFGEYSIIHDSMGLTVPYDIFKGTLCFEPQEGVDEAFIQKSNENLRNFLTYLRKMISDGRLKIQLKDAELEADIAKGLYFHSNIPQGFGIGSSGALVAAVYDKYVEDKLVLDETPTSETIQQLKEILGLMESFFHGKSSGVDPLICYLNLPLLIRGKEQIEPVRIAMKKDGQGAIFLIDTGIARKTEPLVRYYMEQLEKPTYREFVDKQLKPFANNCIHAFLEGDTETLFGYLKKLSHVQFRYFKPMIPTLFSKPWKKGLESGDYYLKLCGAGGGGYILGFTRNIDKTREQLKDHKLEVLSYI